MPAPVASLRRTFFVDESSLAGTKQVNRFLDTLRREDRVVLIGDIRQHEAVDAGRAFAQLQEHGIQTARLEQIVRQNDEGLKQVVQHFYRGEVPQAIQMLMDRGCITEIASEADRHAAIARDYMQAPHETLTVSPDNRTRGAINEAIHDQMQEAQLAQRAEHNLQVLVPRQDLTGAERKWAARYTEGDVIRYNSGSAEQGIKRDSYAVVLDIDEKRNRLTVRTKDGRQVDYDPKRLSGTSVYRAADRTFSVGDQVQFTSPDKQLRTANRERGTITDIDQTGKLTISLDSGRRVRLDTARPVHLDYGYAVTSHSGQGLTATHAIVNIDTQRMDPRLINDRLAYVAGSRMKTSLHIYCNSIKDLTAALSRDISKTSAIGLDCRPPDDFAQRAGSHQATLSTAPDIAQQAMIPQPSRGHRR